MLMVWTFNNSERMYNALDKYADKMGQVGIFGFTVDETGYVSGVVPSRMYPIMSKYPEVNFFITIQNDGTRKAVVDALLNNTNGARTIFMSEIVRLMNENTGCAGIDIDLENCGGVENQVGMEMLISEIYQLVHLNDKLLNICLPPITGPNNSVGGEYWCAYEDYANVCDTMAIMSYAFLWLGSAPGPISPDWWLEQILEYALRVVPKEKILIGMGAWALMWGLHHDYPQYRASSGTYYWALFWMQGQYNFYTFRDGEGRDHEEDRQPIIPFAGYWDDFNKICYLLPHVYDYFDGDMYSTVEYPLVVGTQSGRNYLASFTKNQIVTGTYQQVTSYNYIGGSVTSSSGYILAKKITILSEEDQDWIDYRISQVGIEGLTTEERALYESTQPGVWEYNIDIETSGNYTIALDLTWPWFDNNCLYVKVDNNVVSKQENRFWHVLFRQRHYEVIYQGYLSQGTHTITCGAYGDIVGVPVYGVIYGEDLSIELSAGEANYTSYLKPFKDSEGEDVVPADSYAVTIEVLQQIPDSANIYYDDFRSFRQGGEQISAYYNVLGIWEVMYGTYGSPQILKGKGSIRLKNCSFSDGEVYCRFSGSTGRVGVTFGDYWACYNQDTHEVQLYNGSSLVHSVETTITGNLAVSMRCRPGKIRVYCGTAKSFLFEVFATATGQPGLKCDNETQFSLLRFGSGWWYEPYECVNITVEGEEHIVGRIERTGVTWDNELGLFRVNSDIEEPQTREQQISLDYAFLCLGRQPQLSGMENQPINITYKPIDINMRHMRTYVGDGDGFGIMYYEDADVIQNWYNKAIHSYGIKGLCMWSLGQEDMRIWERII